MLRFILKSIHILGGGSISINGIRAVTNIVAVSICGIISFASTAATEQAKIQDMNEVKAESNDLRNIRLEDNMLVYDVINTNLTNKFGYNVNSLELTVTKNEHKVLKTSTAPLVLAQNNIIQKEIKLDETLEMKTFDEEIETGTVEEETVEEETVEEETVEDITEISEEVSDIVEIEEEAQPILEIIPVDQSQALLKIDNPQEEYSGSIVSLSTDDRYILEHLVMGEAGNQGYEGAALVAQCIRDTMVYDVISSVEQVRTQYKYSGSLNIEPNQDVLNAVKFIFDDGGIAVKHRVQYFYAPRICSGDWHETQDFVIEHGGHKFFAKWQ